MSKLASFLNELHSYYIYFFNYSPLATQLGGMLDSPCLYVCLSVCSLVYRLHGEYLECHWMDLIKTFWTSFIYFEDLYLFFSLRYLSSKELADIFHINGYTLRGALVLIGQLCRTALVFLCRRQIFTPCILI
jgi:hypothetical protein